MSLLEALHRTLGPPPRRLSEPVVWAFHLRPPPGWMTDEDPLSRLYTARDSLVADGRLVLGHLYMANDALFEPGRDDAPAGVVYSLDPVVDRWPAQLVTIGRRLSAFHGATTAPWDPWSRRLLDQLQTGRVRVFHERLPPVMTDGVLAYHATAMVLREHLPDHRLTHTLAPLLVVPDPALPPVLVPHRLWPDRLRDLWTQERPT